jgi:methylglyoxal synthase
MLQSKDTMIASTASATAPAIALVAHDAKKDEMVAFARAHEQWLSTFRLYATGTTGGRIQDACPSLTITRLKSGPLGGDQQIGAMIAEGRLSGLIFFIDPLSPMPHDVDVKALTRLSVVYNIPMALNRATAEMLIRADGFAHQSPVFSD